MRNLLMSLTCIVCVAITAQVHAIDPDFNISQTTTSYQILIEVATGGTNYFTVWQSYVQDGSSYGIFGRFFNSDGSPMTNEFQINQYTSSAQYHPCVASNGTYYLVVWQSISQDGLSNPLYGRFYDNDGVAVTTEFQVSDREESNYPDVASNGTDFLVSFTADYPSNTNDAVYTRLISFDGTTPTIGAEHVQMVFTDDQCFSTKLASNGSTFMVAGYYSHAIDYPANYENRIYIRLVNSSGSGSGNSIKVNNSHYYYTNSTYYYESSAEDFFDLCFDGFHYWIIWGAIAEDTYFANGQYEIYAARYSTSGSIVTSEFRVNDPSYGTNIRAVDLTRVGDYGVVATWNSMDYPRVLARPISSLDLLQDETIQISSGSILQEDVKIASNGTTVFAVWTTTDYSEYDVMGNVIPNDDADNDGVLFLYEWFHSMNTNDSDTDNDWIDDYDEVYVYFTDPTNQDTDYDLLRDSLEISVFGTNPTLPDSDFDGLTDWEELFAFRTDPLDDDSDNDTLIDGIEVMLYDTDPNNADSDSDGFTDAEEIIAGTDPNDGLDYLVITRFNELSSYLGVDVIFIGWNSAPNKTYRIYVQTDLIGPDFVLLEDNWESKGYQTFYMDQGGGPNSVPHPSQETGTRLYRVVVAP